MSSHETPATPFPVFLAALVGYALAAGLLAFGVIGFFATEVSDPFGGGLLAAGVLVLVATLLTSRGVPLGRLVLGGLGVATAVVGIVYAFRGPTYAIAPSLITAGVAAGTAALLFLPRSAQAYFTRD